MQSTETSDPRWRLPLTIGVIVALVEAMLVGLLSAPLRAQVRLKPDTTDTEVRLPTSPLTCGMRRGPGSILVAGSVTMTELTMGLSSLVQRNVVDRTGLSGGYNIKLEWGSETDGPSLFTALQEQLGLWLESTRTPIDVVVIDNVEAASPD